MKSILSFIAGLVVGAGLIIVIGHISGNQAAEPDNGVTIFENEGERIGTESTYKVIQVVDGGALAIEINDFLGGQQVSLSSFWMSLETTSMTIRSSLFQKGNVFANLAYTDMSTRTISPRPYR